jgi:hypothetical protein
MKKNMNEQSSPIGTHSMNGMWYGPFGCLSEGVDGIRKAQNDGGTVLVYPKNGTEYVLLNPSFNNQKPDPELVKKIQSANPNIKHFGKALNVKNQSETLVFYCQGPYRGGIRLVGVNDTIEPPRQAKPAAQPAQQSKEPKTVNRPLWNKAPETSAAPVNEQFENKVLSEQIIRIKDVMGKLL